MLNVRCLELRAVVGRICFQIMEVFLTNGQSGEPWEKHEIRKRLEQLQIDGCFVRRRRQGDYARHDGSAAVYRNCANKNEAVELVNAFLRGELI